MSGEPASAQTGRDIRAVGVGCSDAGFGVLKNNQFSKMDYPFRTLFFFCIAVG
jgi:hypothetical protein